MSETGGDDVRDRIVLARQANRVRNDRRNQANGRACRGGCSGAPGVASRGPDGAAPSRRQLGGMAPLSATICWSAAVAQDALFLQPARGGFAAAPCAARAAGSWPEPK